MNKDVIEVQVRAVLPLEGSFAVFLGTTEKTFVIYVDETVGTAISMFMRGVPKERPLTHDLIGHLLMAFGARVDRVVINRIEGSVFHARLILSAENQLHSRKLVEIDARPSDSIALATQAGAPILVAREVWDQVEDASHTLAKIEEQGAFQHIQGAGDDEGDDDDLAEEGDEDDEEDDDTSDLEEELFGDDELFEDIEDDDDDGDDDDPFGYADDDDDEGEEWKKG